MEANSITEHFDIAFIALYLFWAFFAGLIIYLRREDRREGYPLIADTGGYETPGFVAIPAPKTFNLPHGGKTMAPNYQDDNRPIKAEPAARWPGAPLVPTGNPMIDGVGPASYAMRADVPDLTLHGDPKIVPLRVAPEFSILQGDTDPRGFAVLGADDQVAGTISDVWVDRGESLIRYLEVELPVVKAAPTYTTNEAGERIEVSAAIQAPRRVLVPMPLARVRRAYRQVIVASIMAEHFATVPTTKNPNQVTFLEEDKISAYYGGGKLYAHARRMGPVV